MINLTGKYTDATIYTNSKPLENGVNQIQCLIDSPVSKGSTIKVMPDYHAGKGSVIGTTMTIEDRVSPSLVGVDIGCGVQVHKIKTDGEINLAFLDNFIRKAIPHGRENHLEVSSNREWGAFSLDKFHVQGLDTTKINKGLATLGGGNHFIEIGIDEEGYYYLFVHTGSRYLGAKVAQYWQNVAYEEHLNYLANEISSPYEIIARLKREGREKEIEKELQLWKERKAAIEIKDKSLCYLTGTNLEKYLSDMEVAQKYARVNRMLISNTILQEISGYVVERFDCVHNYIDTKHRILRKGAISAQLDEKVLIPLNMRDGVIIGKGKGNSEWNYSAPHGAGRIRSRTQTKALVVMPDFEKEMKDIYTTCVTAETIDESPMAYKPAQEILDIIEQTVSIEKIVKPIYNFKAAE